MHAEEQQKKMGVKRVRIATATHDTLFLIFYLYHVIVFFHIYSIHYHQSSPSNENGEKRQHNNQWLNQRISSEDKINGLRWRGRWFRAIILYRL